MPLITLASKDPRKQRLNDWPEGNSWLMLESFYADLVSINNIATVGVTGNGTLNTIAMFTPNGTTIGNSLLTQGSGNVTLGGTGYFVTPKIRIIDGAVNGYVLTSDGTGIATWQAAPVSGITTLNTLTATTQTFATGTSGTDFNISSVISTHIFNLPVASATNTGKLSNTDWTSFNNRWSLDGNTVGSLKWIGTVDNFEFPIRTNNIERARITNIGLGVGTSSVIAKIQGLTTTLNEQVGQFDSNQTNNLSLINYIGTSFTNTLTGTKVNTNQTFTTVLISTDTGTSFDNQTVVQNNTALRIQANGLGINRGIQVTANTSDPGGTNFTRNWGVLSSVGNASGGSNRAFVAEADGTVTNSDFSFYSATALSMWHAGNVGIGQDFAETTTKLIVRGDGNSNSESGIKVKNLANDNIFRTSSGRNVIVGDTAIVTTATDGFLYIPSCAGIPTGTPTTYGATVPLVVDSTNGKLYMYVGGVWVVLN